jgi:hypothetical protein
MSEILLQHEIDQLLDQVDGELTSRSRVVDSLLDLRLAATQLPGPIVVIDTALADIPGRTTVANEWWLDQLGTLRSACAAESIPSA